MPGIGDQKGNIKAGRIVRESRKLNKEITTTSVTEGIKQFEKSCSTLYEYCSYVKNPN